VRLGDGPQSIGSRARQPRVCYHRSMKFFLFFSIVAPVLLGSKGVLADDLPRPEPLTDDPPSQSVQAPDRLSSSPPPQSEPRVRMRSRTLLAWGIITSTVGTAFVTAGSVGIAGYEPLGADGQGRSRQPGGGLLMQPIYYGMAIAGGSMIAGGLAMSIVGAWKVRGRPWETVDVSIGPGSASLRGTF
jgi:hypothetical protein